MNDPLMLENKFRAVVDYTTLRVLNDTAVREDYNRSWDWGMVEKFINQEHVFPIRSIMIHPYPKGEAVRCEVILTSEGETGTLDIPIKLYNSLKKITQKEQYADKL